MTWRITWWKSAYAFLHLWSIYVTKTQTTCRYYLDLFYIDCEYRCGEYKHVTPLDRITVSIRVQNV